MRCSLSPQIFIRPITSDDAESIEHLYDQLAAHLRALGDQTDFRFGADAYRRNGCGNSPAFLGFIAKVEEEAVGYLLYTFGYDTDSAMRYMFVIDLVVDERARGRGVGRALMQEAAAVCRDAGGRELVWAVYEKNEPAMEFYRRLGAHTATS